MGCKHRSGQFEAPDGTFISSLMNPVILAKNILAKYYTVLIEELFEPKTMENLGLYTHEDHCEEQPNGDLYCY